MCKGRLQRTRQETCSVLSRAREEQRHGEAQEEQKGRPLLQDGQKLKVAADYKEKVAELRKPQPSPLDVLLSRVGELEAKVKALEEAKK